MAKKRIRIKKLHIGMDDFMKANRAAARQEEIEAHGKPVAFRTALVKSQKAYDRKRMKKVGEIE